MLVNHPQCCSAAALMNTGPQTELSVPRHSPITLENRIQLPATLSLQKKNTLLAPPCPPDRISCSPVMPPAASLSQELTFCNPPSSRTPTPSWTSNLHHVLIFTSIIENGLSQSPKCISLLLSDAFKGHHRWLSFVYEILATYDQMLIILQRQTWICI